MAFGTFLKNDSMLKIDKGGRKEMSQEATAINQAKDDGTTARNGKNKDVEKWVDFTYILKVDPVGFPDRLEINGRENKQSRVIPRFWPGKVEGWSQGDYTGSWNSLWGGRSQDFQFELIEFQKRLLQHPRKEIKMATAHTI